MLRELSLIFFCCLFLASALPHEELPGPHDLTKRSLENINADLDIVGFDSVLIISSVKQECAFILDDKSENVILIKVDTKTVIVMDLLAGSGYSIINKSSLNLKWVTSLKINPSEAISFIKWAILQKSGIMRFSLDFVKTELLDEIHNVVEYLSPSVKLDLNLDKEISLRLIIAVAKQILERTKGILKGIQPLIGLKRIPLKAGIVSVRNTMDGFGQLLKPVLPLDELPDIGLNAEAIFGAENGLVAITHILDRLVKHSDIVPIDGLRALTPATATSIAGKMGGSIISGINGKIRFESKIFKLDNKSIPESKVFNDLVDFLAYSVGQPDLTKKYDEEIKTLLNVLKLQPIIFSILISYIENEDFEVGGFKIHGNNYLFLQSINENNAIHVGVQVLLKWMKSDESKINEFILKLVLTLIDKLDTPTGIYQLNQIGIDAMNINERGEIFRDNLSSEECSLIESDKDLYDKLIGINITSEIIRKISNALITTSSDLNLKDMLNNKSNQVNLEIEATLNVLSKVNSNVFKDYEYKAYLFYKSVTSITNLLEMDIEVLVNGDDDVDCEDSNEIGDSSEESDDVDNNSGSNENDDDGDDSGNSSKNDDGDGDGDDSSKNDDVDGLERSNIDDDDDDGNPSDDDDDDNGSGTDIGTTSTTVDNYNDGSGDNGDNNDDADNGKCCKCLV